MALNQRLNRLEQAIDRLNLCGGKCPSCRGWGHSVTFIRPFIRFTSRGFEFGEPKLVPDDRTDAEGRCNFCGHPPMCPIIQMGLPPEIQEKCS